MYVCHNYRVGHNEVIGVCRTGPETEGLGRDHWNEMLAYPRKPITHWHALGEVEACSFFLKVRVGTTNKLQGFPELPLCLAASHGYLNIEKHVLQPITELWKIPCQLIQIHSSMRIQGCCLCQNREGNLTLTIIIIHGQNPNDQLDTWCTGINPWLV